MKKLLLLGLLPLSACGPTSNLGVAVALGAGVASIPVIHRTPADAVYSWWTGRDCSVVRLDEDKTYCRPVEPPPEPPAYCTRTLASVDCWSQPAARPGQARQVADGPMGLTEEQEANRVRTWPW